MRKRLSQYTILQQDLIEARIQEEFDEKFYRGIPRNKIKRDFDYWAAYRRYKNDKGDYDSYLGFRREQNIETQLEPNPDEFNVERIHNHENQVRRVYSRAREKVFKRLKKENKK